MLMGVLLLLLLIIVLYIIIAPIWVSVDTSNSLCRANIPGIIAIWPGFEDDRFYLHVKIPLKHFRISKFSSSDKKKKKQTKSAKKVSKGGLSLRQISRLFATIRIKQFNLNIDTENYMLNSQLFPICWWLTQKGINCSVNFNGQNHLSMAASTSLFRLGLAWMRGKS